MSDTLPAFFVPRSSGRLCPGTQHHPAVPHHNVSFRRRSLSRNAIEARQRGSLNHALFPIGGLAVYEARPGTPISLVALTPNIPVLAHGGYLARLTHHQRKGCNPSDARRPHPATARASAVAIGKVSRKLYEPESRTSRSTSPKLTRARNARHAERKNQRCPENG